MKLISILVDAFPKIRMPPTKIICDIRVSTILILFRFPRDLLWLMCRIKGLTTMRKIRGEWGNPRQRHLERWENDNAKPFMRVVKYTL